MTKINCIFIIKHTSLLGIKTCGCAASAVPMLLEVSDSHGGKASGLAFLADYLDIPGQETAAFGNAENDLDMMEWAGWGIAVANSPDHVRIMSVSCPYHGR